MFYIAFLVRYLMMVIQQRNLFYLGRPYTLLLTLVGLDGYFLYLGQNYYLLGEWFLGAIVLLYAIYPVLLKAFNRTLVITTLLCCALFGLVFIPGVFRVEMDRNLFSCLLSFEFGMVLMKYQHKWKNNKYIFIISSIVSLCLLFVKMSVVPEIISVHVLGITLFLSFNYVGRWIMKNSILKALFMELSGLSYAVFLVQHIIISKMVGQYMPENDVLSCLWLLLIIIVTIGVAKLLTVVTNLLLKSKPYRKFEGLFIN